MRGTSLKQAGSVALWTGPGSGMGMGRVLLVAALSTRGTQAPCPAVSRVVRDSKPRADWQRWAIGPGEEGLVGSAELWPSETSRDLWTRGPGLC